MTGVAVPRAKDGLQPFALAADALTEVELTWIEKRTEYWVRFGGAAHEQVLDRRRRVLGFRAGMVFAFVRWAANDFGTILSRLDVVRAVGPAEVYQTLPFVRPGGEILLTVEDWSKVERVLQHIDAIEAAGIDPGDVAPDHWRHVHHRMTAGQTPSAYTAVRHDAWLKRRSVTP